MNINVKDFLEYAKEEVGYEKYDLVKTMVETYIEDRLSKTLKNL